MHQVRKIIFFTLGILIFIIGMICCMPTAETRWQDTVISNEGKSVEADVIMGETAKLDHDRITDEISSKGSEMMSVKSNAVYTKPRVINITDLLADPDDEQSLVRMFVTSNMVDLEGIIVSTSCWRQVQDERGMAKLDAIVSAYGEALPNLKVHAEGYPELDYIKSICVFGQRGYSMDAVGEALDSQGSELIIAAVDKEDTRPVWVNLWGGANTVAQALWKVKNTRSQEEVKAFVSKLRVYDVLGQDEAGAWIVTNFPDLVYIRSLQVYGFGGDSALSNYDWRSENIISHGPLGAVYPLKTAGAFEGDTPSFMYQMPTGMNDPEHPEWGSWGGRFEREKVANIRSMSAVKEESTFDPYYMIGDAAEKNQAISRWQKSYQNDFAARMDWSVNSIYENANHHPIAVLNGDDTTNILEIKVQPGVVHLNAYGSVDPDGDELSYSWEIYKEPSTYKGAAAIVNKDKIEATLMIPKDAVGKSIHVILEVKDNGEPNLSAFRRMVISVTDKPRVVISTDFPPIDTQYPFLEDTPNDHKSDPDDLQSMVRFLLYSNEFDVEGLIASSATFVNRANKQNIIDMLDLYGDTYEKLKQSDLAYPTADQLKNITYEGGHGTWGGSIENNIGEGMDSEASDAIIKIVDKEDNRPVWFCVWGDCSNIAQAIYRVKETRSQEELNKFISKIRIYQIAHQDDTIDWLMDNFEDLFIIYSTQAHFGMFEADGLEWVQENIRDNHGILCAVYPKAGMSSQGVCEGDTPSFLYLLSTQFGISDAEDPTMPSWGGQFKQISGTKHYIDDKGSSTVSMHVEVFQEDFKKRLQIMQE